MKKLALLFAAGVGYVLGTKAGRERYEQIKSGAMRFAQNPKVQEAAAKAQETVATKAPPAMGAVADKVTGTVKGRFAKDDGDSTGWPSDSATNADAPMDDVPPPPSAATPPTY